MCFQDAVRVVQGDCYTTVPRIVQDFSHSDATSILGCAICPRGCWRIGCRCYSPAPGACQSSLPAPPFASALWADKVLLKISILRSGPGARAHQGLGSGALQVPGQEAGGAHRCFSLTPGACTAPTALISRPVSTSCAKMSFLRIFRISQCNAKILPEPMTLTASLGQMG